MGRWLALAFIAGCATNAPAPDPEIQARATFDHSVYPILLAKCSANTSGCHADSHGLVLDPNETVAYQSALQYAGDFTANAPILTAHSSAMVQLTADTTAAIEAWLAQEREARGL